MSDYCTDTVPVLLRRSTFCRAFAADAKDFRAYNSWVRCRRPCCLLSSSFHHYTFSGLLLGLWGNPAVYLSHRVRRQALHQSEDACLPGGPSREVTLKWLRMCSQVLSLMLGQAGLHLHTFPEVAFRLDKWTMQGYPCVLDKTPNRQLDIHVRPCKPLSRRSHLLHHQICWIIKGAIQSVSCCW